MPKITKHFKFGPFANDFQASSSYLPLAFSLFPFCKKLAENFGLQNMASWQAG